MRRVKVVSRTGRARDTQFLDTVTGSEIRGITAARIDIEPGQSIVAKVELQLVPVHLEAGTKFMMLCPRRGLMRELSSITFADGETFEF